MFSKHFVLNEQTLAIIEKFGEQMPNMNGHEAARRIRAVDRDYVKRVPIVAMSANAFADDIQNSKNAGMNDHITKPIDINALSRVLQTYIK